VASRRLSVGLMPLVVLLLLFLNNLTQPVHIRRHDPQRDRPNEPLLAMRPYPIQSTMIQIVDRRLNPRMLSARGHERRRDSRA